MSKHLLLTGATGLLGRYLLRDLLLAGVPVVVLARPRGGEPGPARVERLLRFWEGELGRALPRPACLEGDVTADGLGLGEGQVEWVARHCGGVLHAAASLTFRGPGRDGEPWRTNRGGTANVLGLCRRAGLPQLHHVSTAFVCGTRAGVVSESDLGGGRGFRNAYEESKFEAEQLVRAGMGAGATVYRPGVIVGDSRTGYTATYHGLYAYLRFAWVLRQHAAVGEDGNWHVPVRLNLTGEERRNLVPVDWVSAVIVRVVLDARHHGRTYHLTPERPVTVRELEGAVAEYFGYHGPVFAGPGALAGGDLNELENLFYEQVALYEPYWGGEPVFDSANTRAAAPHLPCPQVDGALVRRLIDYAVADRWGKRRA
jgi:nucleoside-diphosphate-sugar epimerase